MCGIKWIVLRNEQYSGTPSEPLEDPVLLSFSRCLEAGLLAVWRRVPRRCLVTYSFDPAGKRVDCDDDGEDAAGGRLLHLLEILDITDRIVVVSRWFGGIKLGPDRFKLINNAARLVLKIAVTDLGGKEEKSKKKKKR